MQAVIQIFKPQAKAHQINLKFSCEQYLKPPPTKSKDEDCVLINMRKLLDHRLNEVLQLPKLIGDERRLKQVLINLVKNALKFSKAQGLIQIKASYDVTLQMLIVHVEDTGVGIA